MRVLLPVHGLAGGVGSEDYNHALANGLADKGHEVTLFGPGEAPAGLERFRWVGHAATPAPPPMLWRFNYPLVVRHMVREMRHLDWTRWDVLVTGLLPQFWAASRTRPQLPTIYIPLSPLAWREMMTYGGPYLQRLVGAATYHLMQRHAWRTATAVVSFTETITRHRIRRYGVTPKTLVISAPGVEVERFTRDAADPSLRATLSIPPGAPIVVSFCRLIESKELPFLFQAFARPAVPNEAYLLVLGGGPEREHLERLAGELGIANRVRFTGFQQHVEHFLGLGDAYAFPSRLESFGLTLVQAMACGLPAVARHSDYDSVLTSSDSIIDEGQTGFLVKSESEMADRLRVLLTDRTRCGEMGRAAAAAVRARYQWHRHIEDLHALVEFVSRNTKIVTS
jgi:glycosyltransferase involved in cell wall biosynthesis